MKCIRILIVFIILISGINSKAQMSSVDMKGYVQTMEMVWINNSHLKTMNTISNRIDFKWYLNDNLKTYVAMRNILSYGQIPKETYPMMSDAALKDLGRMDMTFGLSSDSSHFAYSQFDRAHIQYTYKNFEITVGRQRINWGLNLVWTPNDIFNSFNFLDFDYSERAGSDAVLVQYYTGMASSLQFAYKLDYNNNATYAALYKFNQWNYDFQALAGVVAEDYVLGAGWSGQIKSAGFLGEATYFMPKTESDSSKHALIASISANYTFSNEVFVQASILYNSSGSTENARKEQFITSSKPMTAKDFTLARYALFGQLSFPITPLIKTDITGIMNPNDKSAYIGPSLSFSLANNIDLMIIGQFFIGRKSTEYGHHGSILFGRLKWSF